MEATKECGMTSKEEELAARLKEAYQRIAEDNANQTGHFSFVQKAPSKRREAGGVEEDAEPTQHEIYIARIFS